MDLHTSLVYVAVVVVSAFVIFLVSVYGIKEKSYEEAIAEQRKLPDDHLLMGKKEKGKDKKHKNKTGKKAKEKKEDKEEKEEKTEHAAAVHFDETPTVLPPEPTFMEVGKGAKKKNKIERVKPILVNKDDSSVHVAELTEPENPLTEANHFDRIQPKDSLELIRSHSRETASVQQAVQSEPIINKSPKETPSKTKKNVKEPVKKKEESKDEKKEAVVASASAPQQQQQQQVVKELAKELKEVVKETITVTASSTPAPVNTTAPAVSKETKDAVQPSNKETKKGKKKNDILAQIGGDRDGINVSLLMPLVQKAELSRSEIQILIDQLLNKQQDNPSEHSEWTEGRTDPVIKLKKQLAEKEKALSEEHEASATFQNKLKELRAEFNAERSRFTSQVKQLEEALNVKITEAQTLHTRMQHILESHAAEKQGFARQIEQLQAKVNEDAAIIHKMQEEQGQTQGQMQQELIAQRKQLEVQFGQMRENENALKGQLAQKHIEIQELQTVNINVTQELQATCESSTAEIEMLRQQLGMMDDQLVHSEAQLQDVARQLEESHRAHADFDHRLKGAHRHEQELQKQVHSLQAELKMAKTEASESSGLKNELNKAQAELMKIRSDLSSSRNEVKSEAAEITTLRAAINEKDEQLKYYQSESTKMANALQDERGEVARLRTELVTAQEDLRKQRSEIENLVQQLTKATGKVTKLELELTNATANQVTKTENEALQNGDGKISDVQLQITRLQEENDRISAQLGRFVELQKELKQLREENESLASQLAASTERPAAEGRENGVEDKLLEHTNLLEQKENQLGALKIELANKESELVKLRALVESLETQVNKQNSVTKTLEEDLEAQRSKNNELRTKNWKVMEALSAAESRAKNNTGKSIDESVEKIRTDQQEWTKSLLQRIFPEIQVSEKSNERWLEAFETQVDVVLTELRTRRDSDETGDLEKRNENLRGMVSQYRQIIDETESMLMKLQSHMEAEESKWVSQLMQKENEVSSLRIELRELQKNLVVNEKLQQKITELEARLTEEENLRAESKAEILALKQVHKNSATNSSHEKMCETEIRGGSGNSDQTIINGPATSDSTKSEPTRATDTLIAALEKTLLKNADYENSSVSDNTASFEQSQRENDDSSLTSEINSNHCHTAEHETQASRNPLNGQHQKKHKKKRKGGSGKK
ncbi:kinectin-like isoform X3 [Venturia canescens]|uniref:kinectin-like isoform X3 n=1 Tax=Venturia canescens TaxID=32260 RepID=UPI001C9CC33D|nr:kinectin-like isoform X3 [Venturia canescens]